MDRVQLTHFVRKQALHHGADFIGFSKAEFLEDHAPRLEQWLQENRHGEMAYMENHFDKRLNPTLLVPGAKSVVSMLFNYFPEQDLAEDGHPKISKYAYGQDYHWIIKDQLRHLVNDIEEQLGVFNGRVFVDSAPVLDKAWAERSGLGWVGKNANLINKSQGSFFFIAELICDLEFEYDGPIKDYCGSCTKCMDACPTDAIYEPYKVDGSKCISYFTIELKGELSKETASHFQDWVFGCDICQDVCPWNRFSKPHQQPLFHPHDQLSSSLSNWQELTEEVFQEVFRKSAVKRTKYSGLLRNLNAVFGDKP